MSDVPAFELDRLAGLVERVTFPNEQNAFCVLRPKVKVERELVTQIGQTPSEPEAIKGRVRKPKS